MNAYARYARAQQETASPERLMVLLFEAGLRHIRQGVGHLDAGRTPEALNAIGKASDIVLELLRSLNPEVAPQLCAQLSDVYQFVLGRLTTATLQRRADPLRDAERAFSPLVEAFGTAVAQKAAR